MLSYISYFPDRKRGFLEKQFLDELYLGSEGLPGAPVSREKVCAWRLLL